MITGYELQVRVLGPAYLAQSLQEYRPIYELAPIRLATVAAGCLIAFIWSVFPYPVTERKIVRLELARGLHLPTESFAVAQSAMTWHNDRKVEGAGAGLDKEGWQRLQDMRQEIFKKMAVLFPRRQAACRMAEMGARPGRPLAQRRRTRELF